MNEMTDRYVRLKQNMPTASYICGVEVYLQVDRLVRHPYMLPPTIWVAGWETGVLILPSSVGWALMEGRDNE